MFYTSQRSKLNIIKNAFFGVIDKEYSALTDIDILEKFENP